MDAADRRNREMRLMRAGVAAHVMEVARRTEGGLRRLSPPGLVALLCSGALGPVVMAVAGVSGAATVAGVGVLASVGGNVLSDVVMKTIDSLRAGGRQPSQGEVEEALGDRINQALAAGGVQAKTLRADIAAVLQQIDAVGGMVEAAIEIGDEEVREHLAHAVSALSSEFTEFGFLLTDVRDAAAVIQQTLQRQDAEHRADRDLLRQQSTQLRLLRDELAVVEQHMRPDRFDADTESASGAGGAGGWVQGCPYRGLLPFQENHADVFFGREQLTAELVGALAEQLTGLGMVVVTGASGSGKSSLLRAGLLPALARGSLTDGSAHWPRLVITPTRTPLNELAVHLAALGGMDAAVVGHRLAEEPEKAHEIVRQAVLAGTARHAALSATPTTGQERLVLVVDQFEELFTLGHDDASATEASRDAFITALCAAAQTPCGPGEHPPALVVLGVRGDFWDRCAAYPRLAGVLQDGQFVVGPMMATELRRAIVRPAAAAGLEIEDGLADSILDELRSAASAGGYEAGALPLLSQTMLITWENREGNRLTSRGYASVGGVGHAVQTSAEAAYAVLGGDGRGIARRMFEGMTVVTRDGQLARRRMSRSDLRARNPGRANPDIEAVVKGFTDKRLIVVDEHGVEIAHDVLLHAWPRLRGWLQHDQAERVLHSELIDDASQWRDEHHNDASFLYRGARLTTVRQAVARWEENPDRYPAVTGPAREFLAASTRAEARRARQRHVALISLITMLITAIAGAGAAIKSANDANHQRNNANHQHNNALSRQLAAQSETLTDTDPTTAALLAAAAWRTAPTPEAHHALLNTLANPNRSTLTGHTAPVSSVAFSPDGKTLATGGYDQTVRLWDVAAHRPIGAPLTGHTNTVASVAFSPDGKTLATGGLDHTARLWDVATHHPIGAPLTGHEGAFDAVVFSPDGKTLATASDDQTARLWDVATHRPIGTPLTHTAPVTSVAFSPDGKTLATASWDGTARLWDVATHRPIGTPLTGHTLPVSSVAFSPDGKTLATASNDQTVRLWDVATHHPIGTPLTGHTDYVNAVAFSPDGKTLATASNDQTVRLWDVATHLPIGAPLTGHTDGVTSVAFSPDGKTLATAGIDEMARLWDVATRRPIGAPLTGHTDTVNSVAFSPDGKTLATASDDQTARLWDVATHHPIGAPLTGHTNDVNSVAFSPDGKTLATGGFDQTVLWDVATHRPIGAPLTGHTNGVLAVAFSPDGKTLATASDDQTARLWNVATHHPIGAPLTGHTDTVNAVAFSADGKTLATASNDQTARLWNVATHHPIGAPLTGHTDYVNAVAFSPDGKTLATASDDQTVRLWDVATHRPIGAPLTGHTAPVYSVAFSPDGKTLATGSYDQTVRLWDVATHRPIGAPLTGHTNTVTSVAFSPDGKTLATGGYDQTVRLWDVRIPSNLLTSTCAIAGRSLTRAEWERYAPGEKFQPACG